MKPIPTILTGYGGFGMPQKPEFDPKNLIFMQNMGGIFVVAGIRGGGEYGEKWHKDGILEKKQNSFDDFIGAAEYLISKGYTDP